MRFGNGKEIFSDQYAGAAANHIDRTSLRSFGRGLLFLEQYPDRDLVFVCQIDGKYHVYKDDNSHQPCEYVHERQ